MKSHAWLRKSRRVSLCRGCLRTAMSAAASLSGILMLSSLVTALIIALNKKQGGAQR